MATILTGVEDDENHLPAGWLSGLTTLCGQADEDIMGDPHDGAVTCEVCREMARVIFQSVRLDEVKKTEG